jgi:transposase
MKKMEVPAPLVLPEELEVTEIAMIDEVFTITAHSTRKYPRCPLCGTSAQRFHSHYLHQITDLPSGGKRVCLRVLVRKCFCDVSTCARKITASRLTPFVEPLARVTARLFQVVQALGLATGGMLGARLAERLGIKTSWMTVLRRIMALPREPVQQVVELGIDDFAFRRGRKFGTILVDMVSHKVIDVLPDRKAETAAAWMHAHPEIELVSRDIEEVITLLEHIKALHRRSRLLTGFIYIKIWSKPSRWFWLVAGQRSEKAQERWDRRS